MKVDDLEGVELDYWVAQAESIEVRYINDGCEVVYGDNLAFRPDWALIGPIITRLWKSDRLEFGHSQLNGAETFEARGTNADDKHKVYWAFDPDPLTAIKKALVKRKYGQRVSVDTDNRRKR